MKKVFISYSWDSDEHQEWVVALVNKLRAVYGIDAKCDLLLDKPNLFSMMVQQARINDKIVIVDTEMYTEKADNEQGGVGFETELFYNFFQKQPQKIIVIKRDICNLPFYLSGWNYIDFTKGATKAALDALVLRINDAPPYEMAPITNSPRIVKSKRVEGDDLDNIIPDLRVITAQDKDDYLKEQFGIADETIMSLLKKTKQKNPELIIEREKNDVNRPSGNFVYMLGAVNQQVTHYDVCTYKLKYQGKEAYYKMWLSTGDRMMGKGIFGVSERPLLGNLAQDFNSYQLWAFVKNSEHKLCLECRPVWGSENISDGEELGKYIFKCLIDRLKV